MVKMGEKILVPSGPQEAMQKVHGFFLPNCYAVECRAVITPEARQVRAPSGPVASTRFICSNCTKLKCKILM